MSRLILALLIAYGFMDAAHASAFDTWLGKDSPDCVSIADIQKQDGVKVINLNESQFQFARAMYVAVPPVSHTFPVGDSAIEVKAGDEAMIALVANGKTCARFLAPDFVQKMLEEIENASL